MKYYIDDTLLGLPEFQKRIENTDLIPSRQSPTRSIISVFESLKKQNIKTPKKISELASKSNIDENYLM